MVAGLRVHEDDTSAAVQLPEPSTFPFEDDRPLSEDLLGANVPPTAANAGDAGLAPQDAEGGSAAGEDTRDAAAGDAGAMAVAATGDAEAMAVAAVAAADADAASWRVDVDAGTNADDDDD